MRREAMAPLRPEAHAAQHAASQARTSSTVAAVTLLWCVLMRMLYVRAFRRRAVEAAVREVFEPETGRMRLVRGDGEIIERIVSRQEQEDIRRHASRWVG